MDGAGLLSTPDLLNLMESIRNSGGKLILVGEQQRLDAISHQGSLAYLAKRIGCRRIETIRRQRQDWTLKAVSQFRAGNSMLALQAHLERGLLNIADSCEQARLSLIAKWQSHTHINFNKEAMILTQR